MPREPLDWRAVAAARAGARVGRHVVYEATLDSTNRLARSLLRGGAADGTVVLADEQTRGRGRLGRSWVAPARSGLAVSVCLRLPGAFPLHTLAMAAALAAGDTVRAVVGPRCTLKWPNDVLVDGAKVAGILIELEELDGGWGAVVGIGLNVNAAPDLPGATSLAAITGAPLAREPLAAALLASLEAHLDAAERAPDALLREWRDRLETLGQTVSVRTPSGAIAGLAVAVDSQGALVVRAPDGSTHAVHAGEVTLAG